MEKQRDKLYSKVPEEKRPKHRRLRVIEKEVQKRRLKYDEARLKATKVRSTVKRELGQSLSPSGIDYFGENI